MNFIKTIYVIQDNRLISYLTMKHKLYIVVFAMVSMIALTACGDKAVAPTQLPLEIQSFVQQNFTGQAISYAVKDWGLLGSKYDVVLADGTQIDFDRDKTWDKIESRMNPIPAALIPAPIATYVSTNFAAVPIIKIDKERYGFEVELANDLELKFNQQGALMEMDD